MSKFRECLIKEDKYATCVSEYVELLKESNQVYIWGTGIGATNLMRVLEKYNAESLVVGFCDNSYLNKTFYGNDVLSPDELKKRMSDNSRIIIASQYLVEIRLQLLEMGVKDSNIDTRGFLLAKDYWQYTNETPYQKIYAHINEYEQVYNMLEDEKSKSILINILNSKITLNSDYLIGIADDMKSQYFDKDLIQIKGNEVFCDCGSYTGDTLEVFLERANGVFKEYIAIEADKGSFEVLQKNISNKGLNNIKAYNNACWNEKINLNFSSNERGSEIAKDHADYIIEAERLDHLLRNVDVTYIKMDIEGAEYNAIVGASTIIKERRPVLAICLYHSLEDYYKLPLLMKTLNNDYRLYIRHYWDRMDMETVCYAIPNNR